MSVKSSVMSIGMVQDNIFTQITTSHIIILFPGFVKNQIKLTIQSNIGVLIHNAKAPVYETCRHDILCTMNIHG